MARVVGVDLPVNKRIEIGLTYIYGIGRSRATSILQEAQVSPDLRVRDLDEAQLGRIRQVIETQGEVEGDLRKRVQMDIKRAPARARAAPPSPRRRRRARSKPQ
jgi:small subunit ribosomal protein S13